MPSSRWRVEAATVLYLLIGCAHTWCALPAAAACGYPALSLRASARPASLPTAASGSRRGARAPHLAWVPPPLPSPQGPAARPPAWVRSACRCRVTRCRSAALTQPKPASSSCASGGFCPSGCLFSLDAVAGGRGRVCEAVGLHLQREPSKRGTQRRLGRCRTHLTTPWAAGRAPCAPAAGPASCHLTGRQGKRTRARRPTFARLWKPG